MKKLVHIDVQTDDPRLTSESLKAIVQAWIDNWTAWREAHHEEHNYVVQVEVEEV